MMAENERFNEKFFDDRNDNSCRLCGAEIDFSLRGWQEADPGVVCAECVRDAG